MTTNQRVEQARRTPGAHALLLVGSLGYLGFVPVASGTVSVAVVGVPLALVLRRVLDLGTPAYIFAIALLTAGAVWVSGRVDRLLGEQDSRKNVIDELPGYLIALIGLPLTWQLVLGAFLVERAIDIAKFWPARWIEDRWAGGWGVVFDDVVAGLYTLGLLHLAAWRFPSWLGIGA